MAWNPVEGQLSHIKATMDTSDFDFAAAERIVQTSRLRGVWIFFLCAALLSSVSVLRVLQFESYSAFWAALVRQGASRSGGLWWSSS